MDGWVDYKLLEGLRQRSGVTRYIVKDHSRNSYCKMYLETVSLEAKSRVRKLSEYFLARLKSRRTRNENGILA